MLAIPDQRTKSHPDNLSAWKERLLEWQVVLSTVWSSLKMDICAFTTHLDEAYNIKSRVDPPIRVRDGRKSWLLLLNLSVLPSPELEFYPRFLNRWQSVLILTVDWDIVRARLLLMVILPITPQSALDRRDDRLPSRVDYLNSSTKAGVIATIAINKVAQLGNWVALKNFLVNISVNIRPSCMPETGWQLRVKFKSPDQRINKLKTETECCWNIYARTHLTSKSYSSLFKIEFWISHWAAFLSVATSCPFKCYATDGWGLVKILIVSWEMTAFYKTDS